LLLQAASTFGEQLGDLLDYRHGDTDRRDTQIEGPAQRALV
jgi:hypothetical protein